MKLGLENLQTREEAPAFEAVSIEEALQSGIEAFRIAEEFNAEVESFEGMLYGLANLVQVKETIEAHGVEASLVALVGQEVAAVAPSILAEEVDVEAVKSELSVAHENFAANVIKAIKEMIEKIVATIRGFFDKLAKVAKGIETLEKEVSSVTVDEKVLKDKKLKGVPQKDFVALVSSYSDAESVIKELTDMLGKDASVEEVTKAAKEAVGGLGEYTVEPGKETVGALGFNAKTAVSEVKKVRALLEMGPKLTKAVEEAEKAVKAALGKDASKESQAVATATVKAVNSAASAIVSNIGKVGMQQLTLLKAVKGSAKGDSKKEDTKEEEGE